MLIVQHRPRFHEALNHALLANRRPETQGIYKSWVSNLKYLEGYGCSPEDPTKCLVLLGYDSSPLSFSVQWFWRKGKTLWTPELCRSHFKDYGPGWGWIEENYDRWLNGGLIFYGDGDSGVGGPQFSVRIGSTEAGWSINT